jgi:hypothetical protein
MIDDGKQNLPDALEEDIGGVQGEEAGDAAEQPAEGMIEEGADVQAPDAGEIEWAGTLVKKAPEHDRAD